MTLPPPQPPSEYPATPDSSPSHFANQHYEPTAISATWPVVVTIPGHDLANNQAIRATKFIVMPFARATGMQQLNNRQFFVQNRTTDTFELYQNGLPVDGRDYAPYVSGGQFTRVGPTLPVTNPSLEPPNGVPDPFA